MLREDVTLVDAQAMCLGEPQPAVDPATRCGVTKPLSEQTDAELVVTFRSADVAKREGLNAALAAAFLCADVVAAFRKRPKRPTFEQIARILGVELRTAEQYHTLHTRYPDPDRRPTEGSQRDLNLAFREVKRLMPGASKDEIAQAAAEKAKTNRLKRPAKKPRGRAAHKAGGTPSVATPLPQRAEPVERAPATKAPSAGPVNLPVTRVEDLRDAHAIVMETIDGIAAYLASGPSEEQQRSVVNALKALLRQAEAPRQAPAQPDGEERDAEDDADIDLDPVDDELDEETGDGTRAMGDWSDDDDDPDYEPGD